MLQLLAALFFPGLLYLDGSVLEACDEEVAAGGHVEAGDWCVSLQVTQGGASHAVPAHHAAVKACGEQQGAGAWQEAHGTQPRVGVEGLSAAHLLAQPANSKGRPERSLLGNSQTICELIDQERLIL